ncbi:hypothetical protein Leryth_025014 [Lithospermum erythrorhizon]|nr:hypothetical protein Leryth_025014 [Lithospermum erythrorhizon]
MANISSASSTTIFDRPKLPNKLTTNSSKGSQQSNETKSKKELSRILRTEAAIRAIEKKATSNKYNNLLPKAVLEALNHAIQQNNWESALKIFGLLRKQYWYEPRAQTYTKLLVMLGKCRQPSQADFLFEIMKADGLKPTIDVYTALVSAYGLSGLLDKAFQIVHEMKDVYNCKPDVHTFSILIKCCTKHLRFDLTKHILSEMSDLGVDCNTVTYNTIIDGYGKSKLFDLMEASLTYMIEIGTCAPDIFTFNSVVGAYGKVGQIDKMEKWFDEFQIMGISPDVMTFNILIRSYGKLGMYEKMRSVIAFMSKRFYAPTVVTYNIIIETYGKAGQIEKMEDVFLEMKHKGMKPNTITYTSLADAYGKAGLVDKIDSLMRQIANNDVVLDTPFFNCVISAYGSAGDMEKMVEAYLAMKDRNCRADNTTFASMIQAYNAQGMIKAAQDLENLI